MEEGREVFRIEHRETREGAFWSSAIDSSWFALELPGMTKASEANVRSFLWNHNEDCVFAYLSIPDVLYWFELSELTELKWKGFHLAVFIVKDNPEMSAFSNVQVAFTRDSAKLLRFISLLDL